MSANGQRDESGVQHLEVPTMTITVDPRTMMPSFKCTELPVAIWQMMVGEILRQLDEQRRVGAALKLQEQLRQAAEASRVAAAIGNPTRR